VDVEFVSGEGGKAILLVANLLAIFLFSFKQKSLMRCKNASKINSATQIKQCNGESEPRRS